MEVERNGGINDFGVVDTLESLPRPLGCCVEIMVRVPVQWGKKRPIDYYSSAGHCDTNQFLSHDEWVWHMFEHSE